MPSKRSLLPREGVEIPVSVLKIERLEEMLWISTEPIPADRFPPCIRNIVDRAETEKGKHRTAAIVAAFLGQAGWGEGEAKEFWSTVAERSKEEERIFREWFGKMHCPKCSTLKKESEGYPDLGIADLNLCRPNEKCPQFQGPVEYAAEIKSEEDRSRGRLEHIKNLNLARVFDWLSGKEGTIDLSEAEREELEALLAELAKEEDKVLVYTRAKVRGRLRPKFFLKEAEGPRKRILSEIL